MLGGWLLRFESSILWSSIIRKSGRAKDLVKNTVARAMRGARQRARPAAHSIEGRTTRKPLGASVPLLRSAARNC